MKNNTDKRALKKFGQFLYDLRKKKGLSLRDMASACDIDNSKISKIEKGMVNVTLTTIIELAKGLEVHPKELFSYSFD